MLLEKILLNLTLSQSNNIECTINKHIVIPPIILEIEGFQMSIIVLFNGPSFLLGKVALNSEQKMF